MNVMHAKLMRRVGQSLVMPAVVLAAVVTAAGCGGGGSSSPTSPTSTGGSGGTGGTSGTGTVTITISANGVSPSEVTIAVGQRVTFVNNNRTAHDMSSDPHPEHTDCPAMNNVGFIQPGQTKDTGNFTTARTCGFHDHNQPSNTSLNGRIIIR